jgi:hypothetical protein
VTRTIKTLLHIALVLPLLLPEMAAAEQIELHYQFDRPHLRSVSHGDKTYTRVTMPGCWRGGNVGEPSLPARAAHVLLPFGHEAASVRVIPGAPVLLGEHLPVEPVQRPRPLSRVSEPLAPTPPDSTVYDADAPFPASVSHRVGTHLFRGHAVLTLRLHPVQYEPASGTLRFFPSLRVVVETEPLDAAPAMHRGAGGDRLEMARRVDNPSALRSYPPAAPLRGGYDLLILTTPELAPAFAPLKDHHDAAGTTTEIHTTADVGGATPTLVRDYIRDQYLAGGIEYVLIGGDDELLPARDLVAAWHQGGPIDETIPGDLYFACLDGTWNDDGDDHWGEPNDGPGGGDVDLLADVYVGRAPVSDASEAARFVNKSLWYLQGRHSREGEVLLAGERLGFGGVAEFAADSLEELVDECAAYGYRTTGIAPDYFNIGTLFERDVEWEKPDIVGAINAGLHAVNHLGHGDVDIAMKLFDGDVLSLLTNDDLFFFYSQACSTGHFDEGDCWTETLLAHTDAGAFAAVVNARLGFGAEESTDGPSQRYNREFWDAIFGEGLFSLGKAHQDAKEDNLYRIDQDYMRYCMYGLTYFGDPTIAMRGVSLTGLKVRPVDPFLAEGPAGGPFAPDAAEYTIENRRDQPVEYAVTCDAPWLTIENGTGTIPGGATVSFTVSVNSAADDLDNGDYTALVNITDATYHDGDCTRPARLSIGTPEPIYTWTFDVDPGWSTDGLWAWGRPMGNGGERGFPDPMSGYTGVNVYGYNLDGDYEHNLPQRHLTTGAIDCSNLVKTHLRFQRFLNVGPPMGDHARLSVSNDGETWHVVWENHEETMEYAWSQVEYDISAVADHEPTVYLRWTMGTTDDVWRYSGWNIDDVQILGVDVPPPPCPEDLTGDGRIGQDDLGLLLSAYQQGDAGDVDGDGDTDQTDLGALLGMYGEDCP